MMSPSMDFLGLTVGRQRPLEELPAHDGAAEEGRGVEDERQPDHGDHERPAVRAVCSMTSR